MTSNKWISFSLATTDNKKRPNCWKLIISRSRKLAINIMVHEVCKNNQHKGYHATLRIVGSGSFSGVFINQSLAYYKTSANARRFCVRRAGTMLEELGYSLANIANDYNDTLENAYVGVVR